MISDGGVSRTPRTWTEGDDEPEDGTRVRDALGGEWIRRGRLWHSKIDPRLWSWVLIRGPLVEVLPDAPEPQPEEFKPGDIVRAFWYDEPYVGKVCNASVELTEGGKKLAVRDLANDLILIVDRLSATPAVHCYFESCDGWIVGESDYCPQHAAEYAPDSAAGVSSVSPEGETTPGEGEAASGDLSGVVGWQVRCGEMAKLANLRTAERDALQARIDAALALMDYWDEHGGSIPQGHRLRAALQGDQPTEPETRCMNGSAKQHTLRMVEIIKALKAASADGALPGELDDRASFAQLARAIVDHWPTGEADRA